MIDNHYDLLRAGAVGGASYAASKSALHVRTIAMPTFLCKEKNLSCTHMGSICLQIFGL